MKKFVMFTAVAAGSLALTACGHKKAEESATAVVSGSSQAIDATAAASEDAAEASSKAKM